MAVSDSISRTWLHVPLSGIGFILLLVTTSVAVVAISALATVILLVLSGAPVTIATELSVSQIAADRIADPFSWIAGFLIGVVLLPQFVRYHHRIGRTLRGRDADAGSDADTDANSEQ